jgi:hypothetical protein
MVQLSRIPQELAFYSVIDEPRFPAAIPSLTGAPDVAWSPDVLNASGYRSKWSRICAVRNVVEYRNNEGEHEEDE